MSTGCFNSLLLVMKLVFDGFFETILAAEAIGRFDPERQITGFLRLIASYL